ncbi:MAG: hypothetical protein AAF720_09815 [Pseudomonadota bacterium]
MANSLKNSFQTVPDDSGPSGEAIALVGTLAAIPEGAFTSEIEHVKTEPLETNTEPKKKCLPKEITFAHSVDEANSEDRRGVEANAVATVSAGDTPKRARSETAPPETAPREPAPTEPTGDTPEFLELTPIISEQDKDSAFVAKKGEASPAIDRRHGARSPEEVVAEHRAMLALKKKQLQRQRDEIRQATFGNRQGATGLVAKLTRAAKSARAKSQAVLPVDDASLALSRKKVIASQPPLETERQVEEQPNPNEARLLDGNPVGSERVSSPTDAALHYDDLVQDVDFENLQHTNDVDKQIGFFRKPFRLSAAEKTPNETAYDPIASSNLSRDAFNGEFNDESLHTGALRKSGPRTKLNSDPSTKVAETNISNSTRVLGRGNASREFDTGQTTWSLKGVQGADAVADTEAETDAETDAETGAETGAGTKDELSEILTRETDSQWLAARRQQTIRMMSAQFETLRGNADPSLTGDGARVAARAMAASESFSNAERPVRTRLYLSLKDYMRLNLAASVLGLEEEDLAITALNAYFDACGVERFEDMDASNEAVS